jgi:hypothetical protein
MEHNYCIEMNLLAVSFSSTNCITTGHNHAVKGHTLYLPYYYMPSRHSIQSVPKVFCGFVETLFVVWVCG